MGNDISWEWEMESQRNGVTPEWNHGEWNLRGMELEQNGIARESWKCDTDLWLVHSEEEEANSDLSGEGGSAQSDDQSGLAGDCRQLVVEPHHLILLLVAIEMVHLCRMNSILVG